MGGGSGVIFGLIEADAQDRWRLSAAIRRRNKALGNVQTRAFQLSLGVLGLPRIAEARCEFLAADVR